MSFKCSNGHRMYCIDSRGVKDYVRRSYRCKECGERVSTMETKLNGMGTSAAARRRRDVRKLTVRAMNLKVSITALVEEAQRLVG